MENVSAGASLDRSLWPSGSGTVGVSCIYGDDDKSAATA